MPPKWPLRSGRQQPRQQLAQASSLRGLLGRFCTASKALLDVVDSGKNTFDDTYINGITETLTELGATAGSLDYEGRSALFVALHNTITAALHWPVPCTAAELRAETAAKRLCGEATRCTRDLLTYDGKGAFLQVRQQRDDAVAFASALLASDALQGFAQRLSEASDAALHELLLHQLQQEPKQDDRPMGQQHQQQRQGTAASSSDGGSSSSSGGWGVEESYRLRNVVVPRFRVEQWLPIIGDLGTVIYVIARHDPYAPTAADQLHTTSATFRLAPAAPVGPLAPGRPPPIQALYASAVASSGIFEHAARAMVTVALLAGAIGGARGGEGARGGGGVGGAGAGAGGGGRCENLANSSLSIEFFAPLLQLVGLSPVACISTEGSSRRDGGKGSSSKSSSGGGKGSSKGSSSSVPATRPGEQHRPHPFGPWSRYVLMCLGLRCLHDLDGGSCYGMPPELVRGLPTMVAPGSLTYYDRETMELGRAAMAPVRMAAGRIQVLRDLVQVLEPVRRTGRRYGTGARGTEVYGSGAVGLASAAGAGAGAAGKGLSAAVSGRASGQAGTGLGRWPVVGPKSARDISRRVVGWAVGVARGWAAEEERRRRTGGGGGRGGGHNPWATLGVVGPAWFEQDSEEHVLLRGKSMVGPLTMQALKVYRSTLEEAGAGSGAADRVEGEGGGEREVSSARGQERRRQVNGGRQNHKQQQQRQQQWEQEEQEALAGTAAAGGGEGGVGSRRQGKGKGGEQQQQQQALLVEWYGLACEVVRHAMHWPSADDASGCDLSELMALGLPLLVRTDHLPAVPPPRLAAALSGGYLPCLDALLRRCGRGYTLADVRLTSNLLLHTGLLRTLIRFRSGMDGTSGSGAGGHERSGGSSSSALQFSHDLPWLLAYGNPRQSASLLASMAKMLSRGARDGSGDAAQGLGGIGFGAPGPAAPANEVEEMVAESLASMLSRNLGDAFVWMQERAGGHPLDRSAAGVSAPYASGADCAGRGGGSAADGDDPGAGVSTGYPQGPQRLRLLLSFALAKVVPPLSARLIRQCRQLTMRTGVRASGGSGGGGTKVDVDDIPTDNLQHLLLVLLVAQKTVWRCRDLVSSTARGAVIGPGSGAGGGGSGGGSSSSSASATGQGTVTAGAAGAAGEADLNALADGLQGLLDGEADMAGLVGAALDCLQLLPASDGGQLAATVLELTHCALWSCQHDMGSMRLPDGSPFLSFSASSPIIKKVLWGASSSAERLRAAVTAARFAGYAGEAKHGDALVVFASRYSPGCEARVAPEVPLWLLGPGEVGRELGGSCCCNARCARLEGDSEAGEGQGRGLLVCGRCRGAWYCCRECQAADWAAGHKKACRGK